MLCDHSETTSIPTNPRTTRPVGYAFVDVSTPSEAERAINDLNGKTILDRKVSVQLARKPEPAAEKAAPAADSAEGGEGQQRRRNSTRGRGRGRGRAGRAARGGRGGKQTNGEAGSEEAVTNGGPTNVPGQVDPLTSTTNEALSAQPGEAGSITVDPSKDGKNNATRPRKQRGPPEDGVPSKTKIMVANLPYDLREEKVRCSHGLSIHVYTNVFSSCSRFSPTTRLPPLRLHSARSPNSWSESSKLATSLARVAALALLPSLVKSCNRRHAMT